MPFFYLYISFLARIPRVYDADDGLQILVFYIANIAHGIMSINEHKAKLNFELKISKVKIKSYYKRGILACDINNNSKRVMKQ